MILDRVDAAPSARYRKAEKSGRYHGGERIKALRLLNAVTLTTVAVLLGLIVWASLT